MNGQNDPSTSPFLPLDDGRIAQLMQAAQRGHIHNTKSLFYGVSPDVRDGTGRTALSWLASYDWSQSESADPTLPDQSLQFLLARGANPNLGDHYGQTPLHWAAKAGYHRMVDLLLQKDVLPDLPDYRGRTPLSRTAEGGYPRVVELLLALAKVDPDSRDARGRTPLSWAAENWHRETMTILLDRGASVDIRDREGHIPLWWFINNSAKRSISEHPQDAEDDFQQWLAMLGPTNGVEPITKARRTFLSWACERGDTQLVKHLLQTTWADPNSIDRYRKTPLVYALEWNHHDIADMLIAGIGPNTKKKDIVSLRLMAQESQSRVLKPFLERYKPNLEAEDEYNPVSLIRLALQQGNRATVMLLLKHGASIQNLENGDWFGPCSTERVAGDLAFQNSSHGGGYSSIPLMKMAIQDTHRAAFAELLGHRAHMLELSEDEGGFPQYNASRPSVAVDIAALRNGRKTVRWIADGLNKAIMDLPKTAEETHLM